MCRSNCSAVIIAPLVRSLRRGVAKCEKHRICTDKGNRSCFDHRYCERYRYVALLLPTVFIILLYLRHMQAASRSLLRPTYRTISAIIVRGARQNRAIILLNIGRLYLFLFSSNDGMKRAWRSLPFIFPFFIFGATESSKNLSGEGKRGAALDSVSISVLSFCPRVIAIHPTVARLYVKRISKRDDE